MLFKHPGSYKFNGEWFDFVVVTTDAIPAYLERGWYRTKDEAKNNAIQPLPGRKRKLKELSQAEMDEISNAVGTYKDLMERFNVSLYTIRKLKGGLI